MATVYLHIGAPKTATSTLQRVLSANRELLLTQGVLYPGEKDAQHTLVCDLIDQYQGVTMPEVWYGGDPRGVAWQRLGEAIDSHSGTADTVVVSSELFFGQTKAINLILRDIRSYLQEHEVKIVVYLRRQDQLYGSFYNQDVKGVRQWAHGPYQFYQSHQMLRADYATMLEAWAAVFGSSNILVRPYEPGQWTDGSIVADFCDLCGLPPLHCNDQISNESLGLNQLYIKQCLNRIGFDKSDNEAVLATMLSMLQEPPAKNVRYINKRLYNDYREQWTAVNSALAQRYLDGGALFAEAIPEADALRSDGVHNTMLVEYVERLGRRLDTVDGATRPLFCKAALLMIAEKDLWSAVTLAARDQLMEWSVAEQ